MTDAPPLVQRHQPIALGLIAIALLVPIDAPLREPAGWLVLALIIGVLGLPHGALDAPLGLVLGQQRWGRFGGLAVMLLYALTVGGFVGLIVFAPAAALLLFLALATLHFGEQDAAAQGRPTDGLAILTTGSTPIAGALLFWPESTWTLFAFLAGPASHALRDSVSLGLLGLWGLGFSLSMARSLTESPRSRAARWALLESLLVLLLFWRFHPLVAFTGYFCLLHAPRHVLDLAHSRRPSAPLRELPRLGALAFPATAITLAGAGLVYGFLVGGPHSPAGAPETAAITQAVFWTLAAVTPPHMALLAWARRDRPLDRPKPALPEGSADSTARRRHTEEA